MKFAPAVKGADFYARQYLDAESSPSVDGFGEPVHNVVIGNGERRDSRVLREGKHLSWSQAAVRVGRMEMEVNAAHETAQVVRIFSPRVGR